MRGAARLRQKLTEFDNQSSTPCSPSGAADYGQSLRGSPPPPPSGIVDLWQGHFGDWRGHPRGPGNHFAKHFGDHLRGLKAKFVDLGGHFGRREGFMRG